MMKRHDIQVLRKAGHSQWEVAGAVSVSVDTVRRVEREEVVTFAEDAGARRAWGMGRPSKAAPFRPFVVHVLAKEPGLMSLEVLRRARGRGDAGGNSALYDLIAAVWPRPVQPLVRFEGVPGEFPQHDFGQVDIRAGAQRAGGGIFNDPVAWDLTEGKVKGGYSWAYFALEDPARPEVGKMVQAYKKEYGRDLTLYGWDAVHVSVEAVQ